MKRERKRGKTNDTQQSRGPELRLDRILNRLVRLDVHRRRRLVQHDDPRVPHDDSRERHKLPLTCAEVGTLILDGSGQIEFEEAGFDFG
jgi:hypothetical protein